MYKLKKKNSLKTDAPVVSDVKRKFNLLDLKPISQYSTVQTCYL